MNLYHRVKLRIDHSKEVIDGVAFCDCYVVRSGVMDSNTTVRFSSRCEKARRFMFR